MKIKVVSFNIRCRDDENGHLIKQRALRLKTLLDIQNADVIGLQECTPVWLEAIQKDYADTYEIFNVWRGVSDESTPILLKRAMFEVVDKGCFWLSDTPHIPSNGWDTIGCNRTLLWAELKEVSTGKKLLFLNTHFGFGDEGQKKSVALIRSFAEKYSDLPMVLTGDFNMEHISPAYKDMTEYFLDANVSTVNNKNVTFHGYFLPENKPKLIDYIFVKNCTPKDYTILAETFDGKYPSDHFGIQSTIEI